MPTDTRPDYAELLNALRNLPDYRIVGHNGYEDYYKRVILPLLERAEPT